MAFNFRILFNKNSESIHLNLAGDFYDSSVHELLNTVKTCSRDVRRGFMYTDGLTEVHPFGNAVFHSHFSQVDSQSGGFFFRGEKLAP